MSEYVVPLPCNKKEMRLVVAGLRSGRYQQGETYLNHKGRQCCMGVACEEAIAAGCDVSRTSGLHDVYAYDRLTGYLPKSVANWLGLQHADSADFVVTVREAHRPIRATEANDILHWSFEKIAAELEVTYGLLEKTEEED